MADDGREVRHARDSEGEPADSSLAKHLSELARELQAEPDTDALLKHIVAATVDEIDGADHGGITLLENKHVRAVASSSDIVHHLDGEQERLGEGPCLSSLHEEITVRSDDLHHEQRWPRFAEAATNAGVISMLSVQLFVEGDNLGALNLYAETANAFDAHDESIAMAMAAHAAVAMKGNRIETNLRTALASRDVIGQAKGILMERYKISSDEAFKLLVLASQHRHTKLRDVADELTATGELTTER
jgi:transcriptional regulator with GAF, ATPase, and Fis domain